MNCWLSGLERLHRLLGVVEVLGHGDLMDRGLRAWVRGLRQRRQHILGFVELMPTSAQVPQDRQRAVRVAEVSPARREEGAG